MYWAELPVQEYFRFHVSIFDFLVNCTQNTFAKYRSLVLREEKMWKRGLLSRTASSTRRYYAKVPEHTNITSGEERKLESIPAKLDKADSTTEIEEVEAGTNALKRPMTILEQDEELRLKLEGISGGGGGAGVEYEGGKAVGLKRGVRENMFRVI
ncbi:hypothetical protein ONS95_014157 [Cadophora gregata]|uniref:uncharacterized protein n=1 Tax=Cadophora gregata TaxID=51156 RepID=UPI0026DADD0B|nr:uncharacterized protein ONS95_014157 [Cadophora gregata]KAK0113915.1 hypothetical protein ONS96_014765 [Cadophora gregata f. sp. sojae]KAK0114672.1 hypothetical protein ONS95_014157 [Cadophora gregata]